MSADTASPATVRAPRTPEEGQQLCLACGMCCSGDLYKNSWLDAEEVEPARRLGLPIVDNSQCKKAFQQPCPKHIGDRCTVYNDERKPTVCSSYQCKLLKRYLHGDVELEESLGYVRQARTLIADLRAEIGEEKGVAIWTQLANWSDSGAPRKPEIRMAVGVLMRLLRKVFLPAEARADPVDWPSAETE